MRHNQRDTETQKSSEKGSRRGGRRGKVGGVFRIRKGRGGEGWKWRESILTLQMYLLFFLPGFTVRKTEGWSENIVVALSRSCLKISAF
jgi:hypothetical protein